MSSRLRTAVSTTLALGLVACTPAQATGLATPIENATFEALIALEPGFQDFVNTEIQVSSPAASLDGLEQQIDHLVRLRDDYLGVILAYPRNGYSALALVRVAELHLDLAARARALPPPEDATADNARAFYEITEVYAVPLEEAGLMLLRQVERASFHQVMAEPWVERAQLYLLLHDPQLGPRDHRRTASLRRRALADPRFGPPRRLLDTGKLLPRAARLLP